MTWSVACAITGLAITLILAFGGGMFALGRQRNQIDANRDATKANGEAVVKLGQRLNGNLERIDARLGIGNERLATLTEAVNTLKNQSQGCTEKIDEVSTEVSLLKTQVAELNGRLKAE